MRPSTSTRSDGSSESYSFNAPTVQLCSLITISPMIVQHVAVIHLALLNSNSWWTTVVPAVASGLILSTGWA